MSKIVFQGHIISSEGILPDEEKIQTVSDVRKPNNCSEVHSFLELANCGRLFYPISRLQHPYSHSHERTCTGNGQENTKKSFNKLKQALVKADILAYYVRKSETRIIIDASPFGLGKIQSHK